MTGSTEFERRAAEIDSLDHRGVAGRVIEFDGDLGLIIGGGGASLTAFDAIQQHGGRPANYCEIGGNPSVHKVKELTKHILSKPGVEKISVIMNVVSNTRVDLIARGLIKGVLEAGKEPSKTIAVFRVPGAWEQEGFKILDKYGSLTAIERFPLTRRPVWRWKGLRDRKYHGDTCRTGNEGHHPGDHGA